jgi:hypothetical protein
MKRILLSAIILALISLGSCKKELEGCTVSYSTNYNKDANLDDGSCKFQAQDYIGTYNVTGTRSYQNGTNTIVQNYQLIITHKGETNISISNLGKTNNVFKATIKDNQLILPSQELNSYGAWTGSGIVSGNTITLEYNDDYYGYFYNDVAVKQ